MIVNVSITPDDIKRGFPRSICGCPATYAVERATGAKHFHIATTLESVIFMVPGKKDRFFPLPQAARDWIVTFDNDDIAGQPPVLPITFEIEVDDDLVAPERRCPKCDRYLLDLRGTGFSDTSLRKSGQCGQWTETEFFCNARP